MKSIYDKLVYIYGKLVDMIKAATPAGYHDLVEKVDGIDACIPYQADADNQLADKEFVNSSVATNTATFHGTYVLTGLGLSGDPFSATHADVAAAVQETLDRLGRFYDGSDYVFVQVPQNPQPDDADPGSPVMSRVDRYKCVETGTDPVEKSWEYEWTLNNSSFTAAQWAAIVSGITSGLVAKLKALQTADALAQALAGKRDYTDLSYNTQVTVNAPALHAILTSRGTQLLEYYLPCTEVMPATPQINHVYTWRKAGAEFYITQGVSVYSTSWKLFNSSGEQLSSVSTDNATQGYFPDLTFATSAYAAVTSTKVNSYTDEVQDALALDSNIPAASTTLPKMDSPNGAVIGTPGKYACSDHVHPTDTSRMAATATGADIAVSGSDPTKIATALAGKANKSDVDPMLFAQYYPDGSVKSASEFRDDIRYNFDTTNHTATVKPFCNTGTATNDNSSLVGRVVIPPFVDVQGNGYISDDNTRYKVVGVSGYSNMAPVYSNENLTGIVTPNTVTRIGERALEYCSALTSVSLPGATTIGSDAFVLCTSLASVSLPGATTIGGHVFEGCTSLASVDFGDTPRPSVPSLGIESFSGGVPTTCKLIVPDAQYDAWTAETLPDESPNPWYTLVTEGYEFLRHSEWEYARRYEVGGELDRVEAIAWSDLKAKRDGGLLVPGQQYRITDYVATTNGDMESRSANHPFDIIVTADDEHTLNEHARAIMHETVLDFSSTVQYAVGDFCKYEGTVYKCATAHEGEWVADDFTRESPYFYGRNLAAWDVWYRIDNDTSRFMWALAEGETDPQTGTTGRGVIYRLVDERHNDCPYDSAGLQFVPYGGNPGSYRYTFDEGAQYNTIAGFTEYSRRHLNRIVVGGSKNCRFGADCSSITISWGVICCQFGSVCHRIVFLGKYYLRNIAFGAYCTDCTIGDRTSDVSIGGWCENITIGEACADIRLGNYCNYVKVADYSYSISLGDECNYNEIRRCRYVSFGDMCTHNYISSYSRFIRIGSSCYGNIFGRGFLVYAKESAYEKDDVVKDGFAFYVCTGTFIGTFSTKSVIAAGDYCYSALTGLGESGYFRAEVAARGQFAQGVQYLVDDVVYATVSNGAPSAGFYRCTVAHLGVWDSSHFESVELTSVLTRVDFTEVFAASSAPSRSYYRFITLEDGVSYVALDCTGSRGSGVYYQNVTVSKGVGGTESEPKHIEDANYNQSFKTTYQPADSQTVTV